MAPFGVAGALLTLLLIAYVSGAPSSSSVLSPNAVSEDPEFTDIIENITVPAGRNVKLACSVKNLGSYKVAWMHFEQSAILTVHNHVITRNPRISVTHDKHDKHKTWFLHINNVQEEDKGRYMCQINTVTAKTQFGYLHVVVPPNIDDSITSSDVIVREGANVTLRCRATGSPAPSIKWRRDDNTRISITKSLNVLEWEGETLELTRISRLDMGAYLCIASNGVPPSVSKRIKVSVDFPPMLSIAHQLVGVPPFYNITIECLVEAYPTSLNYWTRENESMIHDSVKYKTESVSTSPSYKSVMKLTIFNFQGSDSGNYKCVAKNPRGETDGNIRIYLSSPPTTIPPPTTEAVQKEIWELRPNVNISLYGQSTTFTSHLADKNSRYQSNLNEIDKSEQKSSEESAKGFDFIPEDDKTSGCTKTQSGLLLVSLQTFFILQLTRHF